MTAEWFDPDKAPPVKTFWWAVEHRPPLAEDAHPAFFLRAVIPGDFRSAGPNPRHVVDLEGEPAPEGEVVKCATCQRVPPPSELESVERVTGDRGHLHPYRSGAVPWPAPTRPDTCWLCSTPTAPARTPRPRGELIQSTNGGMAIVRLCDRCAAFVDRVARVYPGPHLRTTDAGA